MRCGELAALRHLRSVAGGAGRRLGALPYALLAIAAVASVIPLATSGTIPAFQQDWTWPLSRGLSVQWLHAFLGLWDERSLGQANALPWQTYPVVVQVALVLALGPTLGLALWIAALEFAAGCLASLAAASLGVRSQLARFCAAFFYATSPVAFTRIAAGHLAYMLAYALLPLIVVYAKKTIETRQWIPAIALGLAVGIAGCQIQFLALAWLAVVSLLLLAARAPGWAMRLAVSACVALAVQLQALLPLLLSATPSLYLQQRALLSWEYNNSSPFAAAPVMLGYFTHYYESAAPSWSFQALYATLAVAVVLGTIAAWRRGLFVIALVAIGTIGTAGLYGPLSGAFAWLFLNEPAFTAFRDLHYFAAFTALGIAFGVALAVDRFKPAAAAVLVLAIYTGLPLLSGNDLRSLLVPAAYVRDTLDNMQAIARRGPGRVVWLPAEEPVGLYGTSNVGRDFAAYGPPRNPSVADDLVNPQMGYALAGLRAGKPDWNSFAQMGVRYVVVRRYVRSARKEDNLGTGFRLAYGARDDAQLAGALARDRQLVLLRRTAVSAVYELPVWLGSSYVARTKDAVLYSELGLRDVAVAGGDTPALNVRPSAVTADPRLDWVAGRLGWRYRAWLPSSIYPFVWTVSKRTLDVRVPTEVRCVLAASIPPALFTASNSTLSIDGPWKPYAIGSDDSSAVWHLTGSGGVTAIASHACNGDGRHDSVYVMASGYDAGWRAIDGASLVAPALANGWMMAWPQRNDPEAKVYLPAIAQLIGTIAGLAAIVAGYLLARRRDAANTSGRSEVPQL